MPRDWPHPLDHDPSPAEQRRNAIAAIVAGLLLALSVVAAAVGLAF